MKNLKLFIILLSFTAGSVYAQSQGDLLKNNDLVNELSLKGFLWSNERDPGNESVFFKQGFVKSILDNTLKTTKANYEAEFVYFEPKGFVEQRPDDLTIYNRLLNIKQLSNITIKKNGGKTAPLFGVVRLYESLEKRKKIDAIPPVTSIPAQATYAAGLKDERLGLLLYQVDYQYNNGTMVFKLTNKEKAKVLFWSLADENELSITYIIQPVSNGYLHVAQVAGNLQNFDKIDDMLDLKTYFSRRIEAFKGWYFADILLSPIKYDIKPRGIRR